MTAGAARVGAVLMVAAGAGWGSAAVQRWWPECRLDRLLSAGCVAVQDNRYGYVVPTDPWEPIGSAALLAGVGGLLMGAGLLLLAPYLAGRGQWPLVLVAAFLGALCARDGAASLLSARAGRPVPALGFGAVEGLGTVLALCALGAVLLRLRGRSDGASWALWRGPGPLAVSLLMVLISPFLEFAVLPESHDTPPWSGSVTAACFAFVGWTAWRLAGRPKGTPVVAGPSAPAAAH